MKQSHIVVIGGGIAGAAAAQTLHKFGHKVTILEKQERLGGRIHSVKDGDFIFELGAGFLTNIYINIFAFLQENGLDKYLRTRKSKTAIVRNSKLFRLSAATLLGNTLLPFSAKMKLLPEFLKIVRFGNKLDWHTLWQGYIYDNTTVKEFFTGKNGQELVDYLLQPMLDGYFYWSAEKTSEVMVLLILKFLGGRRYSYPPGLQSIPEKLTKDCDVFLAQEVKSVQKAADNKYKIITNKKTIVADGIVCATTATNVPKIFDNLTPKQKEFFSSIHYSATVVVAKTYNNKTIPVNYAFAYPRKDGKNLGTITIVFDKNSKKTLVKLFASGFSGSRLCVKTDAEIENVLMKDAMSSHEIFDFSLPSNATQIQRWNEAIPEFTVGYLRRLKSFKDGEIESKTDRIVFAGDYIGGPFMEGAFTSGVQAAQRLQLQYE